MRRKNSALGRRQIPEDIYEQQPDKFQAREREPNICLLVACGSFCPKMTGHKDTWRDS